MPNLIRRRDLDFLLYDVLEADALCAREKFREHSREVFDQVITAAEKIAEDVLQPSASIVDTNEPVFRHGKAILPQETHEAIAALLDGGFIAASINADAGGLQLPLTVAQAANAFLGAANSGITGYLMLTTAAANLILAHGNDEQRARFATPLVEGRFFGTMCLSEPHAGSSLGDIRTRADPQMDGTYRLFGTKMWVSGGEHDLVENIIHLVLARIPGAPPGAKGISLFIVPRHLVLEDGTLGKRNDVHLAGVNHKMGNRGTVNTVLNFGETTGAAGYLVGEPGQGLFYMFHMMNEARIGVGFGATATAYTAYLHSLAYARERAQGRSNANRDPASPMTPIIEHPDVKRMLMQQKAYCEGGLCLGLYGSYLADMEASATSEDERGRLRLLLEILTPIMKSWPSEYGLKANDLAIQIHGGYGYTREFPVERLYRDNRLNHIHEGTKGIQGLDLLGRKVSMQDGRALETLDEEIRATLAEAEGVHCFNAERSALEDNWQLLLAVTSAMQRNSRASRSEAFLANATLYLDAFGHIIVAWLWLKQALKANQMDHEDPFIRGKLQTCRYFFRYELPMIEPALRLLNTLDTTCMDARPEWF